MISLSQPELNGKSIPHRFFQMSIDPVLSQTVSERLLDANETGDNFIED